MKTPFFRTFVWGSTFISGTRYNDKDYPDHKDQGSSHRNVEKL